MQVHMAKYLVEVAGVDVNQQDEKQGWTPLHRSARVAHYAPGTGMEVRTDSTNRLRNRQNQMQGWTRLHRSAHVAHYAPVTGMEVCTDSNWYPAIRLRII